MPPDAHPATPAFFAFGQRLPGYDVPVLNERAVRAAAGIVFFFALVSFMNAWLTGNFQPTRVFVVAFLIDFAIRIFVNPRWAPSLIVGQWMVRRQQPEWVGAPQKRFAWAIGFALAVTMFYLVVLQQVIGPVNLLICAACLMLLFFETAFGICIGCTVYNLLHKKRAQLCPGEVCHFEPAPGAGGSLAHGAVVLLFLAGVGAGSVHLGAGSDARTALRTADPMTTPDADANDEARRCQVPAFAKTIGHEAQWKLHNNCP